MDTEKCIRAQLSSEFPHDWPQPTKSLHFKTGRVGHCCHSFRGYKEVSWFDSIKSTFQMTQPCLEKSFAFQDFSGISRGT